MKKLILVLCVLLLSACVTVPPVTAPTTPTTPVVTSAELTVQVKVAGTVDNKLPGALVSLITAANPTGPAAMTDGAGNATVTVGSPGDYDVSVTLTDHTCVGQHVSVATNQASAGVTISCTKNAPVIVALPRLVPRGRFFRLDTGDRWTIIGASDFNLFNRYQNGEDITPILKQRAETGFNLLRVWTLYNLPNGIGVLLNPDYTRMSAFAQLCASYGLYVEFTAYTSTEVSTHWDALVAATASSTNVLRELVNEGNLAVNKIDMDRYSRPTSGLSSHGSGSSEAVPAWSNWDYVTFHTNGSSEEQRKIGHNAWEIWEGPTFTNETSRYPDVGMWSGVTPAQQQMLAYDSAAGAALLCAGSLFHSVAGKSSILWDDATLAVAKAWVAGAESVPLSCQDGGYKHREDLEKDHPELLRVYQRGDAEACIVPIRKVL